MFIELHPIYPHYQWYPEVLANASHSAEYLARKLRSRIAEHGTDNLKGYINEKLVKDGLGITNANDNDLQQLIDVPLLASYTFADMISRRAQIGWSTHGHSAVDVNIYGTRGSEKLHGNRENIQVGEFLREYLDVDVKAITKELNKKSKTFEASAAGGVSWMGKIPTDEEIEMAIRLHDLMHVGTL